VIDLKPRSFLLTLRSTLLHAAALGLLGSTSVRAQTCSNPTWVGLEDVCTGDFTPLIGNVLRDLTLCGAGDDFDLGAANSCTGRATPGPDLQLTFRAGFGDPPCILVVGLGYCADSAPFDGALYLVGDCENYGSTCVAGSDNDGVGVDESFEVAIDPTRTYTLIIDSRDALCGRFRLGMFASCIGDPTTTEHRSWGAMKSLYR